MADLTLPGDETARRHAAPPVQTSFGRADYLTGLFGLAGRTAVVTGASSGIGRGIAEALAAAGARVVLLGRSESALGEATDGIRAAGGEAAWRAADLADRAAVARVAAAATEPYGEPDILLNAAGINPRP